MRKKIFVLILAIVMMLSLCACSTPTDSVTTYTNANVHIERHYQDNGDLFCIKETNLETGTIVATYFYWKHDEHGRRTLSRTECITIDKNGTVISHEAIPGV